MTEPAKTRNDAPRTSLTLGAETVERLHRIIARHPEIVSLSAAVRYAARVVDEIEAETEAKWRGKH